MSSDEQDRPPGEPSPRALLNAGALPMIFVRRDGTVLELNEASAKNLGRPRDAVIGRSLYELVPAMAETFRQRIERVFDAGERLEVEDAIPLPDGVRHFRSLIDPVFDEGGQVVAARNLAFEVTAEHAMVDSLRRSDAKLAIMLEHSPYVIVTCTREGVIRYINRPGPGFQLADVVGTDSHAFVRADHHERYDQALRAVFDDGEPAIFVFPDIHGSWWEAKLVPIKHEGVTELALSFSVDISEQRRAEDERARLQTQLQQTQKLESLGVLAGGIAHDFNNLLLVIGANTELAATRVASDDAAREYLSQVLEAASRAAELCKQMLAYAGRGKLDAEPVDLSRLVAEMAQLVSVSVSKGARLTRELAPDLPAIQGDPSQLRQVVLNLIMNASDAIGAGQGMIAVCTRRVALGPGELGDSYLKPDLEPGEYVALEVTDTGCGMAPATRERIFEPFFSTKGSGRGLGLSATLGIIRGHGGAVFVDSTEGAGTSVRVIFPALAGQVVAPERRPPPRGREGKGTVLVIDDEEGVRRGLGAALRDAGYEVLVAKDGREGLAVFDAQRERVRLVLLDLTMPVLSGADTLRALRERDAALPVVVMSGYAATPPEGESVRFLEKPFSVEALLAVIQDSLRQSV